MRVFAALVFALVFVLAACGGGSKASPSATTSDTDETATTAIPASPTPTPPLATLVQGLTLTGHLAGQMTAGTGECLTGIRNGSRLFQLTLRGDIAGAHHSLKVVTRGYTGPGSYSPTTTGTALISLDSGPGNSGTFSVDSGETSGTIDADLLDGQRVSGTWACTNFGG